MPKQDHPHLNLPPSRGKKRADALRESVHCGHCKSLYNPSEAVKRPGIVIKNLVDDVRRDGTVFFEFAQRQDL
jgi:hypothetical protein